MCSQGPLLSNGTRCSSCGQGSPSECEQGCEYGAGQPLGFWKAVLRPQQAGGAYTITVSSSESAESIVLRRVTFGDVFVCSGQSNMDLAMEYTFDETAMNKTVIAGGYSNIRLFQYGDMDVKYESVEPIWSTTQGVILDPTSAGGTWANLSAASRVVPGALPFQNLFGQFSATCFYFASALTDLRNDVVPIGLIQTAIGGRYLIGKSCLLFRTALSAASLSTSPAASLCCNCGLGMQPDRSVGDGHCVGSMPQHKSQFRRPVSSHKTVQRDGNRTPAAPSLLSHLYL